MNLYAVFSLRYLMGFLVDVCGCFIPVAAGRSSALFCQPLSILLTSSWDMFTRRVSTDDTLLHVTTHLAVTATVTATQQRLQLKPQIYRSYLYLAVQ